MTTKSTRRNPKWRNSQFLSGSTQPATSISRVIAQPLQGSPLRSAIDGLPSVSNSSDAGSLYSVNEMNRKHERNEEAAAGETDPQKTAVEDLGLNKLLRVASAPSADLEGDQGVTGLDSVDSTASRPTPLVDAAPTADTLMVFPDPSANMPFPSASPKTTAKLDSTSTSPKVSWFNSLSFARGKDIQRQTNGAEGVALNMKAVERPSSSPQQIAETSPSSPPLQRPDCARANSDPDSVISSVDDEVHVAKVLSAADCAPALVDPIHASIEPTHPSGEEERERTLSVSSLNPSTSRFMLRIPLLGRPKVPLEQVVRADRENKKPITVYMKETDETSSHADANKDVGSIPKVTISSPQPSSETLSHPHPQSQDNSNDMSMTESPSSPHNDESLSSTDNRQAPTVPQAVSTSSSWWGYLGWSDADTQGDPISAAVQDSHIGHDSGNAPSQASQSEGLEEMTEQSKPVPEDHINVGRNEVTAALPEAVSKIEDPSSPTVKTTPDLGNTKPASLFSAETIKSQGSAWYSPWGWYATSPVVPSSPGAKKVEQLEDAHKHAHSKTESEMVKEEALAREDLPTLEPNTTHQTQATLSPSEEVTLKPSSPSSSSLLNPIESSISTQRSGWASFFMSNTLLTKTITNESHERDENGMEVMEVDEGEDKEETPKPDERQAGPSQAMMIVAGKKRQATSLPSSPTSKSPPSRPRTSKEREPKKSGPPAPPLTNSETIKNETANPTMARSSSPTPSGKSGTSTPGGPNAHPPNLVLPTWKDTFLSAPRSNVPPPPTPPATQKGKLGKTFDFVSGVLFSGSKGDERAHGSVKARGKQKERNRDQEFLLFGNELPKALDIIDQTFSPEVLNEKCRVVVIGVAGWSPGAVIRTIAGGLPSSSSKFVDMSCSALEKFEEDHGFKFKKITKIPLEGDGTIERKVAKVHTHLLGNEQWVDDLHAADVIFVATHSQGSIVATHLLDKLIREGHILTPRNVDTLSSTAAAIVPGGSVPLPASLTRTQKICCLALCGIHLGPLRYLKTSSLLQPYIQYFENAAAGELFDFQNTETPVSQNYVKALRTVMDHGTKMVYVASLNDQVVPIYSGLFTAASHPRILRALYIDGDAYHSSDFLSNLLVLLIRIMNSGLSDSGLLAHLSEATAGTLSGVGHSTAYEEPATYSLAVDYLFLTTDGTDERTDLVVEGFNAVNEQNDYEIPWSLRDLIADDRVAHFFADEFSRLRNAFDDWSPKTTILRDIKRKLQPIQRLSSIRGTPLTSRL